MESKLESLLSKIKTPMLSEGAKVIEIFYQLYVADERIGDLLKTIRHITLNVENVRGLRRLNASHLSTRNLAWIDALISDTADAIGGLATLVERARVDKETRESISLWNKGRWVAYFGPQVKEKYLKLTMCHQSLLSVFPFLFTNHSGLAPVLEETKGDGQQPCDPTMMKWLDWQDQRHRRKSNANLKAPTLLQRPMSASSSSTDTTLSSVVSSNSSATTGSTIPEASFPESGLSYYPAAYSQSTSPTSASPDLVTGSLDLTYPVFHNKLEDNYDPPSALPRNATDGSKDDIAPSTKPRSIYDGADGLQVYVPLDGSEVLCDLVHQLQVSPFDAQNASSSHKTATEQNSEGYFEPAEAIRLGRVLAMPQRINGADNPADAVHKIAPGHSLPFSSYLPPFDFERPTSLVLSSVNGDSSEFQSLDDSKDSAGPHLEDKKPPTIRAHSDTYTPRYPTRNRPELKQSGRIHAPSGGGRSLSAGQRGARRGSRSWLAFHSSRSDLRQGDGWGEG